MKNLFPILTISMFILLVCFSTQLSHAQVTLAKVVRTDKVSNSGFFDVKVTNFLFKKVDDNNKIIAFTEEDAQTLYQFFEKENSIVSVESHSIDKSVRVISLLQKDGSSSFEFKNFVDMLDELGYVVTQLRCNTQKQYIASTTPKSENKVMVGLTDNKQSDCNDCKNVKISKEDLEMFKNMDYGGSVIELDLGAGSSSPVDMN